MPTLTNKSSPTTKHQIVKPSVKLLSSSLTYIAMTGMLVVAPLSANAGFLDSISELNRTVSSIGDTARNIKYSKQNVDDLSEEVGFSGNNQIDPSTDIVEGSVLVGKLSKTRLYSSFDKSSPVVSVLSPEEVMIFMGTETNGYYHVQSDKGEGWVAKPLVKVQY